MEVAGRTLTDDVKHDRMKPKLTLLSSIISASLVLVAIGCATSKEKQTTALLRRAGFRAMVATTFEKQERLKSLKADQITTVKSTNGVVYYVFPLHSEDLLYVGRAPQYSTYTNLVGEQKAEQATLKAERPGADASWTQSAEGDESWRDVWTAPSDF